MPSPSGSLTPHDAELSLHFSGCVALTRCWRCGTVWGTAAAAWGRFF